MKASIPQYFQDAAREKRVQDDLDAFLAKRFGTRMMEPIKAIHQVEEERPIETLWDDSPPFWQSMSRVIHV